MNVFIIDGPINYAFRPEIEEHAWDRVSGGNRRGQPIARREGNATRPDRAWRMAIPV